MGAYEWVFYPLAIKRTNKQKNQAVKRNSLCPVAAVSLDPCTYSKLPSSKLCHCHSCLFFYCHSLRSLKLSFTLAGLRWNICFKDYFHLFPVKPVKELCYLQSWKMLATPCTIKSEKRTETSVIISFFHFCCCYWGFVLTKNFFLW